MNAFLLKIAYDELETLVSLIGKNDIASEIKTLSDALAERVQTHCWKGDFFARALVGGKREGGYTYLGAGKDGLSTDPNIDGSYFLNSFSWSILAGVATDEQIRIMLDVIKKSGSWFSYEGNRLAQGKDNVKRLFEDNPEFAAEVEAKVRELMMKNDGVMNEEEFELDEDDDFDIRTIEDDE
jgi:hypothetical protein